MGIERTGSRPRFRTWSSWFALAVMAAGFTSSASSAVLSITPIAFDFGDISLGASSAQQTVTVTNVSGTPQTLSLAGGAAGVFGGAQNCQGQTLAPGASCQIFYEFTPSALGPVAEATSLIVNGQSASFSFKGNAIDAFRISPIGFDFGQVALNSTSAQQTVTVTNVSGSPQTLSLAGGAAGVFGGAQNCQGQTLAPGASCQITYNFSPTSAGAVTESTTLLVNGQSASFTFAGSGGPSTQPFLISPVAFDFGNVSVGASSAEQTVTITNVSALPQTVNLAGGAAGAFGGAQNCQGQTLAPGASCQVTYRFTPTGYGETTGSTSLSVNGQLVSFSFRGSGIDPFLISPIGFDFGEVELGATSIEQIVDVLNVSGSPQTLSLAGGEFGGAQNCQGNTLAPGAACQIFYAFTPTALGLVTGDTTLLVNGQSAVFSFMGIGINANVPIPEPATLAILGLGLAILSVTRRRRR